MKKNLLIGLILAAAVGVFYLTKQFENSGHVPKVVVTIKPIHSLVCKVLQGVEVPVLMDLSNNSPHTSDLRPSDISLLKKASAVVWVGDAYETSMGIKLRKAVEKHKLLTLMDAPKLKVLHLRTGDVWGVGCCHSDHHHHHDHSHNDGHVWLDVDNAVAIVKYLGEYFAQNKPEFADLIKKNTKAIIRDLEELDRDIKKMIKPFKHKPYIIYHDSLQYFDKRYKTKCVGALVHEPGEPLAPKHLRSIQKLFDGQLGKVLCVLSEDEHKQAAQHALGKNKAKIVSFDYLGTKIQPGPNAYTKIMQGIAKSFQECCVIAKSSKYN